MTCKDDGNRPASREAIAKAGTLVVKVGSSLLASLRGGLDTAFIARLVGQFANLAEKGKRLVLVSSGAVAAGTAELGLPARPIELSRVQAAAAVGQVALMQTYRQLFQCYRLKVGQVLLTRDNLQDRRRFLYARNTLLAIMEEGAVPIVNENDAVAVEELRLKMGDNDSLAVSAAQLVDADAVILLSDVEGLYDRSPTQPGARLIPEVREFSKGVLAMAGGPESGLGSGGMASKVNAARAAAAANIPLIVVDGRREDILLEIARGRQVGTIFLPSGRRASSYRQWLAYGRSLDGALLVDAGARLAIVEKKKSLLPIGIREVRGNFREGDSVAIADLEGREFARGLANFSSDELRLAAGRRSGEIPEILGHLCVNTAVHRDNLLVFGPGGAGDGEDAAAGLKP